MPAPTEHSAPVPDNDLAYLMAPVGLPEEENVFVFDSAPFGGKDAQAHNALWNALHAAAARDGRALKDWLAHMPRTSLVCFILQELHRSGYTIVKID